jgi:hypothetical protein
MTVPSRRRYVAGRSTKPAQFMSSGHQSRNMTTVRGT